MTLEKIQETIGEIKYRPPTSPKTACLRWLRGEKRDRRNSSTPSVLQSAAKVP